MTLLAMLTRNFLMACMPCIRLVCNVRPIRLLRYPFYLGSYILNIQHQDDTILDLWGVGPNRPPIDTHHPAVRTHPVTGLKALNVNGGFVTGFAELKKLESGKLEAVIKRNLCNLR